jgi:hypothetical protein
MPSKFRFAFAPVLNWNSWPIMGSKIVFHEPLPHEFGVGQVFPNRLNRMGEEILVFNNFCHNE